MNEDSPIQSREGTDSSVDISTDAENISHSDQVFDISEDNISPITEEKEASATQVFSIKKPAPKPFVKPLETNRPVAPITTPPQPSPINITPSPTFKVDQAPIATTPAKDQEPTKNVLDPNYKAPSTFTQDTPTTAASIKIPPSLPETPAFKGTLDQKPHVFTPTPLVKPEIKTPTTTPAPQSPPTPLKPFSSNSFPHTSPITADTLEKSIGSIPLKDISGPIVSDIPKRAAPIPPPPKITLTPIVEEKIQPAENLDLGKIRTYESDVANVLSNKKTSVASIAIAENQRENDGSQEKPKNKTSNHSTSKFILLLISIVFIAVGVGGAYYLYSKSPVGPLSQTTSQNIPENIPSAVPVDSQISINIRNLNPLDVIGRVTGEYEKPQNPGTIREIILTNGQTKITGPEMLTLMDIDAPDILKRSLTEPWMLGIYADDMGDKNVFIVTSTNFFQNTFAGMLQWESLMADDLKQYLALSSKGIVNAPTAPAPVQIGTSTATQKEPVVESSFSIRGQFEDRIIMNKDVRVFRTSQGKTLFLYSFINNSTLVFTTKEQTITEILDRLEKRAFVR